MSPTDIVNRPTSIAASPEPSVFFALIGQVCENPTTNFVVVPSKIFKMLLVSSSYPSGKLTAPKVTFVSPPNWMDMLTGSIPASTVNSDKSIVGNVQLAVVSSLAFAL